MVSILVLYQVFPVCALFQHHVRDCVGDATCTVMAPFLVIVWYIPMKATLLSRS